MSTADCNDLAKRVKVVLATSCLLQHWLLVNALGHRLHLHTWCVNMWLHSHECKTTRVVLTNPMHLQPLYYLQIRNCLLSSKPCTRTVTWFVWYPHIHTVHLSTVSVSSYKATYQQFCTIMHIHWVQVRKHIKICSS